MPRRPDNRAGRRAEHLRAAFLGLCVAFAAETPAIAQDAAIVMGTAPAAGRAGAIVAQDGFASAMGPGAADGFGYVTLANEGSEPDSLIALSSPSSNEVEVREATPSGEATRARNAPLDLPARGTVSLQPGQPFRLVFVGASRPFAEGAEVAVTLTFAKAGRLALSLPVRASDAAR